MEFKECKGQEDFLSFFSNDELALRHTNYYHYTSLATIDKILSEQIIRLTPLAICANDILERDRYSRLGKNIFSLCFSTGTSESLPLWYLYSGIDGQGARLSLKKKDFKLLIQTAELSLAEVEDKYPYSTCKLIPLSTEDYSIVCRDILYLGKDTINYNLYRAKYNGQVINGISEDAYNSVFERYGRFVKSLIWFYEKETRLQVEVKNTSLFETNKNYVLLLKIHPVFKNISIRLAPEFEETNENLFESYKGLKSWVISKLQTSDYAGQLRMGLKDKLCRQCTTIRSTT